MKEADITISVIVLTYNHAKYIRQALDSILKQKTTFCYEILVGDDASTDGTSEIVKEYAERFPNVIRAFIRERNLGATKNLYDLFQHANGRYIANCEGDDYWSVPDKLQRQVNFLETHPDYSACTHNCLQVNENGQPLETQTIPWVCVKEEYTLRDFKGIYLPGQPATLVHRNFFRDASHHDYSIIYKANPCIADRTVAMILAALGKIRRFTDVMSCYRIRTNPVESSATTAMFRDNPQVNWMQYEMTCQLEAYMAKEFHIPVRFTKFKMEQLWKGRLKELYKSVIKC